MLKINFQKYQSKIIRAYQTLSNPEKRSMYDNYGMDANEQRNAGGAGGFSEQDFSDFFKQGGAGDFNFEDIFGGFEDIFGGGGRQRQSRRTRGSDISINISITFNEAITGVSKTIKYNKKDNCNTCNGSKCAKGTGPTSCGPCSGKGFVNMRQGPMSIQMGCSACGGSGTVIKNPCGTCKGQGLSNKIVEENISIPKGINNGNTLRIVGKGNKGLNDAGNGDLLVNVKIEPDTYFKREDYNILTNLHINISTAVLGGSIVAKTIEGDTTIQIPKGTADGTKIRLNGKGITHLAPNNHKKGDHIITIKIIIPAILNEEHRNIFEKIKEFENKTNN